MLQVDVDALYLAKTVDKVKILVIFKHDAEMTQFREMLVELQKGGRA